MQITVIGNKNIEWFLPILGQKPSGQQTALGVVEDGRPVAAAVFSREGSACYIEHIYVEEESRRQGVGSFLLSEAMDAFNHVGVTEFLAYYPKDDVLTAFLRKLRFFCSGSDPVIEARCQDLINSKSFEKMKKKYEKMKTDGIVPVRYISSMIKNEILTKLASMNFDARLFSEDEYDPDISFYFMDAGHPQAVILAKSEEKDIYVTLLASFGDDITFLPGFLVNTLDMILSETFVDSKIIFVSRNEKLEQALRVIFGDMDGLTGESSMWSAVHMLRTLFLDELEEMEDVT